MLFTPQEVICALYRAVLGRDPDPAGLRAYSEFLTTEPERLIEVAQKMHFSEEHAKRMFEKNVILDHSQYGEFGRLLKYFIRPKRGIIVDVGANGRERSNSFDFARLFGWRLLLVEANPNLWRSIEDDFLETDYQLERCAISDSEGTMPFYLGINNDVSSLRKENAEIWGQITGEVQVEVRRLAPLLKKHNIPHNFNILSLDIEGFDVAVLNDLMETSDYRPEIVIIETSLNFSASYPGDTGVSQAVISNYKLEDQTAANMILSLIDKTAQTAW